MGIDDTFPVEISDGPTEQSAIERGHSATRDRRRIMMIVGSRPEVIKLAPIERVVRDSAHFEAVLVATGQNDQVVAQILEHFSMKPAFNLGISEGDETHTDITVRMLGRLTPIVETQKPDVIVVQGDTTAALAGALVGFYQQIPVVHVEAGLRSGDHSVSYPEELNRKVLTQLASLHLAPTEGAKGNLLREGVDAASILVTGNTVIDALLWSIDNAAPYGDPTLDALELDGRKVVLFTSHGRDSWAEPVKALGRGLASVARSEPNVVIVAPIDRNSFTGMALLPEIEGLPNVVVCDPIPYGAFVRLINRSEIIVTDSGSLQEEGPTLGRPVLVTRDTTDRPEAYLAGGVRLIGTDSLSVSGSITKLLHDDAYYASMAVRRNVYGDGQAGQRAVDAIAHLLGLGPRPGRFFRTSAAKPVTV